MIEKIKKLMDYFYSQRINESDEQALAYNNGRMKGLQDALALFGEHYDPATTALVLSIKSKEIRTNE